jgi:hypothetical protein
MAAASVAVRDLLMASARSARVLAAFPSAVYLQLDLGCPDGGSRREVGTGVVALLARDAVRLPLGIVIDADTAAAPFAGLGPGDQALVGDGLVRCDAGRWRVLRWWDPRVPVVGRVDGRVGGPAAAPSPDPRGTDDVDDDDVDDAVARLVGAGPGLTPAGDDVLCGALAALAATGDDARRRALAAAVLRHTHRTTSLSAGLLRCAAAGHGLPQLTRLLTAVLRGEPLDRQRQALTDLLAIGHTSGAALATGALLTLRAGPTPSTRPPLPPPPPAPARDHARPRHVGRRN